MNSLRITCAQAQQELDRLEYTTNEVGCFLAVGEPDHPNGYFRYNLRHTRSQMDGLPINYSPYYHQLAMISKGEGAGLSIIGWQVSHLCHHPSCFNPDHLVRLRKNASECQ